MCRLNLNDIIIVKIFNASSYQFTMLPRKRPKAQRRPCTCHVCKGASMSGQTVRNHRDRPRHIPTVNAGPRSSGIQAGSHNFSTLLCLKLPQTISQIKTQVMVPVLPLTNLRRVWPRRAWETNKASTTTGQTTSTSIYTISYCNFVAWYIYWITCRWLRKKTWKWTKKCSLWSKKTSRTTFNSGLMNLYVDNRFLPS